MKRRDLMKLTLLLVVGAVINIAVAWGCTFRPIRWRLEPSDNLQWPQKLPNFPEAPSHTGRWDSFGYTIKMWARTDYGMGIGHIEAGWPLRSARHELVQTSIKDVRVPGGVRIRSPFQTEEVLPCKPLWPGFAINTIFYAGIAWLIFAAPFKLRRWRRIKRGQCGACSYPVGASAVCSECGAAVTPRTIEP